MDASQDTRPPFSVAACRAFPQSARPNGRKTRSRPTAGSNCCFRPGAWHTQSKGDCEIMSVLAGKSCDDIEQDIAELLKFDDPPVWSVGKYRGVASKIDSFFAVQASVTPKDLRDFILAAEIVLSEEDPALDLPEDQRAFANLYGKSREHSGVLRNGICETLVLLAVHGNSIFGKRLGINIAAEVDQLVRRLLSPLTPNKLLSQMGNMPLYAEASPQEFLRIIREDLNTADPQVYLPLCFAAC